MKTAKILALAAIGTSFLLLLAVVVFRSPQHVQTSIDLLKVVSAWPPILLALALYFMHRYHEEIRSFLSRATEVGPSGIKAAEKQLPPPEPPPPELGSGETAPVPPTSPSSVATSAEPLPEAPAETSPSPEPEVSVPESFLQRLWSEREYWKLQFLDQFLVSNTKNVLAWFASKQTTTMTEYHRTWRHSITDEPQRATVIDVLMQYGLLAYTPIGLQITPDGRRAFEYFRDKGFSSMPPAPDPKMMEALGRALGMPLTTEPKGPSSPNRYLDALRKTRELKKELEDLDDKSSSGTTGEGR